MEAKVFVYVYMKIGQSFHLLQRDILLLISRLEYVWQKFSFFRCIW